MEIQLICFIKQERKPVNTLFLNLILMKSDNYNQGGNPQDEEKKDGKDEEQDNGQDDEKSDPLVEDPENQDPVKKDRDEDEEDEHKMM